MRRLVMIPLGLALASNAFAGLELYMVYPGIAGESERIGFVDQTILTSVDMSHFRLADIGAVDSAGTPKLSEIKIRKEPDLGSPLFMLESMQGQPGQQDATIHFFNTAQQTTDAFMTITLKRPLVTGYSVQAEDGNVPPSEYLTIAYDEICVAYRETRSDGSLDAPEERCWNAATSTGG